MPESQRIAVLQRGMRRPSVHEQYVCTVALEHEDGTVELPDRTNPSGPAGIATPAGFLPFVTAPHLRPLPSTGITRRPQYYYGPLRHPADPACPSRGSGCCVHNIEQGFPCCCFLHLPYVPTPITPAETVWCLCRSLPNPSSAFPFSTEGRLPHCAFRGLHSVHNVPARYGR